MTINGKIRDEQIQYDINREAVKILALLLGKIDKNEFLTRYYLTIWSKWNNRTSYVFIFSTWQII